MVISLVPSSFHGAFEIGINVELFGEAVVLKIALEQRIEVAEPQCPGPLIHLIFKRRKKSHFPHSEFLDLLQIDDDAHSLLSQPALEKMLDLERLVVRGFSRQADDDPAAHFGNPVVHSLVPPA